MSISPADVAALAAIAFLGATIFGITGFGAALVTIPLSTWIVPLPFALAMFSLLDLANTLRFGLADPKNALRAEWGRMAPMILAGTVAGVTALVNLPRQAATLALGAFVTAVALSTLARGGAVRQVGRGWAWVAGLAGGITSTLFGAGGPPYAIYLSRRGLSNAQYRATLGRCTTISISLRVATFLVIGLLLDADVWLTALAALPAALAGMMLAARVFRAMSRDLLMRAVGLMLAASGVSLVWRAF
jgi:hypothetical protein